MEQYATKSPHDRIILNTHDGERAGTCTLVLQAVNIPHRLEQTEDGLNILVPESLYEAALREIVAHDQENRDWPPPPFQAEQDFTPLLQPPTLLLIGSLMIFYSITGPWDASSIWFTAGSGDSDAILNQGQWWRLLTPLTLHADLVHLLGNCLMGGVLIHAFCRLLGNGLGLFALLLIGACGNLMNVFWHGPGHHFVGFSTAVFGLIGMLSSMGSTRRKQRTGQHLFIPLMSGAALLAMTGSSGENTDFGAHLAGLIAGLVAGWFLDRKPFTTLKHSFLFQSILFTLACTVLIGSWSTALKTATFQ
ncbi:MAG: rhomboid family intramembrane serine protease [Desulfobulbaceae bacterium]|uniref:Rhomboid family intramembrane serine protease n=1 Tax=Candidatus Desulfatifera sulfidica TaxID=2841691 RepID=A0A8J6TDT9_9BACT|nr:rhomboid family intramembrane serine protease [Candidatus Desulfatifera sulfidica]